MNTLGQRLGAHAIAGAVLLITASALIWIGVAFAAYALYLSLLPQAGAPGAAAIAAVVLVAGPLGWTALLYLRAPRARAQIHAPESRVKPMDPENATLNLLAQVAQEKPLLAVIFAGILGASEAVLRRKNEM